MREIHYSITDEMGLHARPAGQLVKAAVPFPCDIKIGTAGKMVDAKRIMGIMGLVVKQGDEIIMTFDGENEEAAAAALEQFLKDNL